MSFFLENCIYYSVHASFTKVILAYFFKKQGKVRYYTLAVLQCLSVKLYKIINDCKQSIRDQVLNKELRVVINYCLTDF